MLNIRLWKSRLLMAIFREHFDYNTRRTQTWFCFGSFLGYCFLNGRTFQRKLCMLHKSMFLHTFHSSAHFVTVAQSQLGQSLPLKNLANFPFTSINVSKHLIKGCICTRRVFIGRGSFQQWLSFKASAIWRRLAQSTVTAAIYNASCRLPFNPVTLSEIWKIVPIQERLFKLQWDR